MRSWWLAGRVEIVGVVRRLARSVGLNFGITVLISTYRDLRCAEILSKSAGRLIVRYDFEQIFPLQKLRKAGSRKAGLWLLSFSERK
jgi:hypothetical protein